MDRGDKRQKRGRRSERGAVLIEAAIVMPLLFVILFGILEWGLVFRASLTLSESTRAGARVAAALPRNPAYSEVAAAAVSGRLANAGVPEDQIRILVIYKADPNTGGLYGGGSSDSDIENCSDDCFRYTWDPALDEFVLVAGSPEWTAAEQAACGGDDSTDYIGIYVAADHQYVTGLFGSGIGLSERTVMRLEPLPMTDTCKPGA